LFYNLFSMLYSKKSVLYYATVLSLLLAPACQCKKETTAPGKPPEIPRDSHLVTAIRINNVPKDSLVYNDQQQVTERWDYNTTYRIWQNYTTYQYNKDGFVTSAAYYNENDNTLKSLSQRDSIVWTPGKLIIYSTNYRELGTEISGYDTTRMELNNSQQLTLLGSRDTLLLDFPPSKGLFYTDYQYDGNNIRQYTDMSYIIIVADPSSGILYMDRFEMEYNQVRNPLYKLVAKNPLLFRQLIGDQYQLSIKYFYPFLGSERYVTNVKYQSEAGPLTNAPVAYKMVNGTSYAQTQTLAALNMVISYSYKVVKID
jgi:hypothetical protein